MIAMGNASDTFEEAMFLGGLYFNQKYDCYQNNYREFVKPAIPDMAVLIAVVFEVGK